MGLDGLKARAGRLAANVSALSLAIRDPRTPWYAKALAVAIVAYAVSPIDLIPDFIPVLGYVDDLLVLPLAIALVIRWIPRDAWEDCRQRVESQYRGTRRLQLVGAAIVLGTWLCISVVVVLWLVRR